MNLLFKNIFRKFVKKQSKPFQLAIEDEIEKISQNYQIGELKKDDLAGFRVHKFKFHGQLYLVAYQNNSEGISFYLIGTHENFYRELKHYLRS